MVRAERNSNFPPAQSRKTLGQTLQHFIKFGILFKALSIIILSSTTLLSSWITFSIGNKLSIQFPTTPKMETILTDYIIYSSKNSNCDFEVHNDKYPEPVFPKTDNESSILFEQSIKKSKERGVFINSKRITIGKMNGIEIKSYFSPTHTIKLIQVERIFFINYRIYTLRCIFKTKNNSVCEKDCSKFFTSLKLPS